MVFKNIDMHGCSALEELPNGSYGTLRVPVAVEEHLSGNGQAQNRNSTGIEFRFVMKGDAVKFRFAYPDGVVGMLTVYHGEFVADWPETTKMLSGECEVTIPKSRNLPTLRKLAEEHGHRFSPDVIRLVFTVRPQLVGVEGEIEPPSEEMLPKKKYLAYGSSITHGSIALHSYFSYVERVAANLSADALNLGFAGSAFLEKEMADYIAGECEFDLATLELGINLLLHGHTPEDYEERVRYFVRRIAEGHPEAKIFAIDVYTCKSDIVGNGAAERYREILASVLKELDLPNVIYVNGKTVLRSPDKLTTGLVHPNPDGILEMADNLTKIIKDTV
ncbi:MAG: hypothetical protein IKB38_09755 [Clostridia bacterium]|nr:hypothetical protein [Clostridia bacterium]